VRLGLLCALVTATMLCACSASGRHDAAAQISPLPIATGDYPALGHAPDFSWIAGRLESDLACRYVRFGAAARAPWGGRIAIVAPAGIADLLQSGDTVVLHGNITPLAFGRCGAPAYLVSSVEEH